MTNRSILETIGNTPLVQLNKINKDVPGQVFVKLESFNPGHSAKDRIAMHLIESAERRGDIKPGATLVEATSGNTGFAIAMVAAVKGYKCILTVKDKLSKEKEDALLALGAQLVKCPSSAKGSDPDSYYQQAQRIAKETPNAYYLNQNFNLGNSEAHYLTTGPEIWAQSEGKITCLIASAGTGGTLSGTARYLKEQNPDIRIIACDAYGSALKKYHETGVFDENEIYSYRIEGTGKNIIPDNVDFDVIDQFVKVTDRDAALQARQLAKDEGIMAGYSSGGNIQCLHKIKTQLGPDDYTVIILPDHGSKYLSKVFNDQWMIDQGFMEGQPNSKALAAEFKPTTSKVRLPKSIKISN